MWKYGVLVLCLSGYCLAGPVGVLKRNIPIGQQKASDDAAASSEPNSDEMMVMSTLTLPSNATSIRADITDNFSCEDKSYGYYADVDNDCQIFHVCLPVTYADGKENTFRWSFICPEETVFSQDSFTCMRPEDMMISCEESFKYYQLNDNFGNVEQEAEKEMNEMPASEANKPSMETEPEPVAEVTANVEPIKPAEKVPVKVPKPNRRKPAVSNAVQKKPGNSYPLRKMPQTQPQLNSNADVQQFKVKDTTKPVEEVKAEQQEEEIKPTVQKFTRRPVPSMSNSFKDKMPSSKPETVNAIRSDLYNQKRKRPTVFNKKPIEEETEKAEEDATNEESPAKIPEQTLSQTLSDILNVNIAEKAEAEAAKDEYPAPAEVVGQTFFEMAPEMSNVNTETQVADTETQASETNEVQVKPQEAELPQIAEEPLIAEDPQVLEAFEEIPAVVAEVEQAASQSTDEDSRKENEIPEEPLQHAEIPEDPEEIPTAEESQASEEMSSAEESQAGMEAEAIQEPIETAEEPQAALVAEPAQETQAVEESQVAEQMAEETQMLQETNVDEGNPTFQETEAEAESAKAEIQTAEESQAAEEAATSEDNQTSLETQAVEEEPENVEESKPVMETEMSEEADVSQEKLVAEANESQAAEETSDNEIIAAAESVQSAEDSPASAPEQPIAVEQDAKQEEAAEVTFAEEPEQNKSEMVVEPEQEPTVLAEPAIFEDNSEEAAGAAADAVPAQTIEEMEEERPAEAPESVPASESMAQQDPIVQEMFGETNDEDKKQTIGGFKQVDPVMAAEAEQLIADFINTLRKNEFVNETPGMPMQVPIIEEAVQESLEDTAVAVEEPTKEAEEDNNENQAQVEEVKQTQSEEISSEPQIVEAQESAEESKSEELKDAKPSEDQTNPDQVPLSEEATKAEEMTNIKDSNLAPPKEEEPNNEAHANMMSNTPHAFYHIPIQVITTPTEEMSLQESDKQPMPSHTEEKLEAETPAIAMDDYKPLSIDDIVELVKERLDQMPKDKMETPMQLAQVLSEGKPNDEQVQLENSQVDNEQAPESQQSEEEIVMPIYHRAADIGQVVASPVPDDSAAVDNAKDDIAPQDKSSRMYRSRSMLSPKVDPRKRRFLFRSDES